MSPNRPRSDSEDDKASTSSAEQPESQHVQLSMTPKLDGTQKADVGQNGFLAAPISTSYRPLSPDSLSILSLDEFEQLHPRELHQQTYDGAESTQHPLSTSKGRQERLKAFWVYNKGCAYMLFAQFFGVLMNVTTRLLEVEGNNGKGLHPFQILFARMSITLVLASAWMWYKRTPDFPLGKLEVRWLLVIRGVAGLFGVFGIYYSLLYLPLADATVITFLAPGLASWACSILIKEPFTRVEQVGGLISLIGVVLIARPTTIFEAFTATPSTSGNGDVAPGNSTVHEPGADAADYDSVTPMQRFSAIGVALLGVVGAACAYTTLRVIGKRAHPLISVNYFAAWCTVISIVMQLILPDIGFLLPANLKEWGYLVFLGICGFLMQFLLTAAFSYEKSSRTTNLVYTQMLFALAFDKLVFGHTPSPLSILGSSLVLGSAIVVTAYKSSKTNDKVEDASVHDEESGQGLMGNDANEAMPAGEDCDASMTQEIPMRTFR